MSLCILPPCLPRQVIYLTPLEQWLEKLDDSGFEELPKVFSPMMQVGSTRTPRSVAAVGPAAWGSKVALLLQQPLSNNKITEMNKTMKIEKKKKK
jgi:hypothetical protein